jgi:hypothetical protein
MGYQPRCSRVSRSPPDCLRKEARVYLSNSLLEIELMLRCVNCGKPIKFGSFCTVRCMNEHTVKEKKDIAETTLRSRAARRRALIKERGHRCEQCGREKWMRKPIPLFVFHRDGDTENWQLDNLRLLCPNCRAYIRTWLRSDQH